MVTEAVLARANVGHLSLAPSHLAPGLLSCFAPSLLSHLAPSRLAPGLLCHLAPSRLAPSRLAPGLLSPIARSTIDRPERSARAGHRQCRPRERRASEACAGQAEASGRGPLRYGRPLLQQNPELSVSHSQLSHLSVCSVPGWLGKLTLTIPWRTLNTDPVVITIDRLHLIAVPASGIPVGACAARRLSACRSHPALTPPPPRPAPRPHLHPALISIPALIPALICIPAFISIPAPNTLVRCGRRQARGGPRQGGAAAALRGGAQRKGDQASGRVRTGRLCHQAGRQGDQQPAGDHLQHPHPLRGRDQQPLGACVRAHGRVCTCLNRDSSEDGRGAPGRPCAAPERAGPDARPAEHDLDRRRLERAVHKHPGGRCLQGAYVGACACRPPC